MTLFWVRQIPDGKEGRSSWASEFLLRLVIRPVTPSNPREESVRLPLEGSQPWVLPEGSFMWNMRELFCPQWYSVGISELFFLLPYIASTCCDFLIPKWEVIKLQFQPVKLVYIIVSYLLLCKKFPWNNLKDKHLLFHTVSDGHETGSGLAWWFQFKVSCGCSHLEAAWVSLQHGSRLSPRVSDLRERQKLQCLL